MTVSAPFNTMTAPLCRAAARARLSLSPCAANTRANSPSCGVMTQGPRTARVSSAALEPKTLIASASSSTGLAVLRSSIAVSRVASFTPAPGPIKNAVYRESDSRRPRSPSCFSGCTMMLVRAAA